MASLSLLPHALPLKVIDCDGGSYYAWNNNNYPFLGSAEVSAAMLTLRTNGFAFPHYADCNKIGYVAEGSEGIAGIIDPITLEEKVVKLRKGDAIVVPGGVVSWWYNAGQDTLKYIYLGESIKELGQLRYTNFGGPTGILRGFSTSTLSKAYDMTEEQANDLINTQKSLFITKLEKEKQMPKPSNVSIGHTDSLCFDFAKVEPDFEVKNGGTFTTMTVKKHGALEGIKLSGNLLKLEGNAMFGPSYYEVDSGVQLTYVVKGSGWVEVVGMNGKSVLDSPLKAGDIIAVPKFYLLAIGAADEGIECFSVVTNSEPILGQVAGKTSVWNALCPEAIQATLNISPEFCKQFKDKLNTTTIIRPSN